MKTKILLVDDDLELTKEVKQHLVNSGLAVQTASTVTEAVAQWPEYRPEIMLLDFNLPDGEGIQVLEDIVSKEEEIAVVMLSGYGTIQRAVEAIKMGAEDFLTKPVDPDHLTHVLQKLITHRRLKNRVLAQELEIARQRREIVGSGKRFKETLATARDAAGSDATILLTGETGTGKHLFAHLIHQHSRRADSPFIYVNCASLSETLLESDLFGHERGSFTGAHQQKKGRIELADQGTLFLDEIGELPINLQAKLLHFIEYGEFQRVGAIQTLQADSRIICATNRDLSDEIKAGRFREDLYFRIHVIEIQVPALRERRDDIPILFNHFLEHFSHETGKKRPEFEDSLLERMCNYAWPGNVREFQNAMERAVVLCKTNRLSEKDFPFLTVPTSHAVDELLHPGPLQDAVSSFKRRFIQETLKQCGGNQSKAAGILKIQRTYLNRLIKELGVAVTSNR